jgi:hypothetical protein
MKGMIGRDGTCSVPLRIVILSPSGVCCNMLEVDALDIVIGGLLAGGGAVSVRQRADAQ